MGDHMIYEGKAKRIFETSNADQLRMEFKDSLTAFNAQKKGQFLGKGMLNCAISTYMFKLLLKHNISNHWIATLEKNQMIVVKTKIIPLEVVVRNVLAGSLAKKLNKPEGQILSKPLVELYFKDDGLGDPFVSDDQAFEFGWVKPDQLQTMKQTTLKINKILSEHLLQTGLRLIDFKIEFGINSKNEVILADEISPDCMRLWDLVTSEKFDKDRFRRDLGHVEEAYQNVLNRLEGIPL